MDPLSDISVYASSPGRPSSPARASQPTGYVRPIDVKGQLGARPIQQWKETLREEFVRDGDYNGSKARDSALDGLRQALGWAKPKSDPVTE